jgi:hypothetical protein
MKTDRGWYIVRRGDHCFAARTEGGRKAMLGSSYLPGGLQKACELMCLDWCKINSRPLSPLGIGILSEALAKTCDAVMVKEGKDVIRLPEVQLNAIMAMAIETEAHTAAFDARLRGTA